MRSILGPTVAVLGLAAFPALAADPPEGVYDCYGPSMAGGRSPDIREGAGRGGTLNTSGGKFSIVGPGMYLSRGGKTGRFTFDGLTLSMVDGPYSGIRYHKDPAYWTFRMLRENGDEGPIMCPRNEAKDPRNPTAW